MYVETPVSTHALDENQANARNWSFALLMIYMGEIAEYHPCQKVTP